MAVLNCLGIAQLRRHGETRVFSQGLGKRKPRMCCTFAEHSFQSNENVVSLTKQTHLDQCEQVRVNKQIAAMCPSCVSRDHEIRFGNGVNPWGETDCARAVHESIYSIGRSIQALYFPGLTEHTLPRQIPESCDYFWQENGIG